MKYIFFGTPEFSAIILDKLISGGFTPEAVVCNPDRPVGRKKIITPPPVKARIMNYELGIKDRVEVLQPEKLDSRFMFHVSSFKPDVFIVAAYAKIIPKEILRIPRLGAIGVHPSLLPKHRGSSPIQAAILGGDEETGITLFLLDEKIDHGPILATGNRQLANSETCKTLIKKLAELAGDLLIETLPKFFTGEIEPTPQDELLATYTKKFAAGDAFVDPELLTKARDEGGAAAIEIDRKIRALNPEPGVWTTISGKRMKLIRAELRDNRLVLKEIQKEGGIPRKF